MASEEIEKPFGTEDHGNIIDFEVVEVVVGHFEARTVLFASIQKSLNHAIEVLRVKEKLEDNVWSVQEHGQVHATGACLLDEVLELLLL